MLILLVMSSGSGVTDATSGEAALRTEANARPVRNTRHPRVANCRTTSSPMPLLAPVTKAMPGIDKPPVLVPSHPPNPGAIISTRQPTDCLAIVYPVHPPAHRLLGNRLPGTRSLPNHRSLYSLRRKYRLGLSPVEGGVVHIFCG